MPVIRFLYVFKITFYSKILDKLKGVRNYNEHLCAHHSAKERKLPESLSAPWVLPG